MKRVVLDTNIFVAAGFNKKSSSANIIKFIKNNKLRLVWNKQTRNETKNILKQIPLLSWNNFSKLFKSEDEFKGKLQDNKFEQIKDMDDRKFAALSSETDAYLITNDDHLLEVKDGLNTKITTPKNFVDNLI